MADPTSAEQLRHYAYKLSGGTRYKPEIPQDPEHIRLDVKLASDVATRLMEIADEIETGNAPANKTPPTILQGEKPRGIKLNRLNDLLGRVGVVLVLALVIDKEGKPTYTNTRLWLERSKEYDTRCQQLENE